MEPIGYNSIVVVLSGACDGSNRTFETPSKYVSGTLRLIMNGQVYEQNDDRKKWTEIDDRTIRLEIAPRTGDVLQAFYQDKNSQHWGLDVIQGSPFDPRGIYP